MMGVVTSSSARITGWGTALPDKIVTNADLEDTLDTSDAWIIERTGIRERRDRRHHHRARRRGRPARARPTPASPATTSTSCCSAPPRPTRRCRPAPASIQHELGVRGGAVDLNAACSGFVYGLVAADGFLRAGMRPGAARRRPRRCRRIVDWDDRRTAILFGDGAGAVVLERGDGPGPRARLRPRLRRLAAPHPRTPTSAARSRWTGQEVFRRAVRIMVDSAAAGPRPRGRRRRRRRAVRPPPGQHPHHRRRPAPSSASARTAPPTSWPPPATPPRRRSRWPWPRRPTPVGSRRATACCSSASAPGMSWASAVIEWATVTRVGRRARSSSRAAAGASAWLRPRLRGRRPPRGRHLVVHAGRRARPPRGAVRRHRRRPGRRRGDRGRGASSGRSRCSSPTPASPATACSCACPRPTSRT